MSVNETNLVGRKYRVWDAANNIWKRLSFWTKASDVEMENGTSLENEIGAIKSTLSDNSSDILKKTGMYCVCSTSSSTAAKTASLTGFTLQTGAKVTVYFENNNTASSPTLNINSTGAIGIRKGYHASSGLATTTQIPCGPVELVYNGTYWVMENSAACVVTYGSSTCNRINFSLSGDTLTITTSS